MQEMGIAPFVQPGGGTSGQGVQILLTLNTKHKPCYRGALHRLLLPTSLRILPKHPGPASAASQGFSARSELVRHWARGRQ